jgi:uncharacterized membrane protein
VASQPDSVQRSIDEFVWSLAEAVIIVLVVCFFSLGLRTGLVVALSIPLVLAVTFFGMRMFDVGLHKISLGALILALGLLVDDAIIAVEMMLVKMEQGWERSKAAAFAYTSTAGPMLSGTLVTVAGFLPIATAQSSTGEYTRSIFQVNAIALLASWLAAVVVVPYLGYLLLPDPRRRGIRAGWRSASRASSASRSASAWASRTIEGGEDEVFRTLLQPLPRPGGCLRGAALVGDRRHAGDLRGGAGGLRFRAAAVLPQLHAARAAGSTCACRKGQPARHPGRGREAGSHPRQGAGHRQLRGLRGHRQPALLPAPRPAAAGPQLCPVRGADRRHPAREALRERLIDRFKHDFPTCAPT